MFKLFRTLILTLTCLTLLIFIGCGEQREINDVALVSVIGIDQTETGTLRLTLQIINPAKTGGGTQQQQSGQQKTRVQSAEGVTLTDAMANLQRKIPELIFLGQSEVLIVGEKLAKTGVQSHLDFITRYRDSRLRSLVFVCRGEARDILSVNYPQGTLDKILTEDDALTFKKSTTLNHVIQSFHSESRQASIPWIETGGQGDPPFINGMAIFQNDRLIKVLNAKIAQGISWLQNNQQWTFITVKPNDVEGYVSTFLLKSRTELKPRIENGKWHMEVNISTIHDIVQNTTHLQVADPGLTPLVEEALEENINNRVKEALQTVQNDLKADVFGFGETFQRKYPQQWSRVKDHWDDKFPTMNVTLQTEAVIKRPGLNNAPSGMPEREVRKK